MDNKEKIGNFNINIKALYTNKAVKNIIDKYKYEKNFDSNLNNLG